MPRPKKQVVQEEVKEPNEVVQGVIPEKETKAKKIETKIDVRIGKLRKEGNIKAFVSVNINDCIAISNIKVMDSEKGMFVSMPSYKTQDGKYKEVCFPITKEFREELFSSIMQAYILKLEETEKQEAEQQQEEQQSDVSMQM